MTFATQYRKSAPAPLKTYSVNLWPLEGCEATVKASTPTIARNIAARVFGDDDITSIFADPDYWTIEEILTGRA